MWCLLLLTPIVAFAQPYLNEFPFHQQTKYFDFRFKRNSERIKTIARFADGFIGVINRDFFPAGFDYPVRVLVLEDRASFQNCLRQQFSIANPPNFGIFLYQSNLFATYEDSGLGTFAHEIMHPLVERNLKDRPVWAIEGIPTFFEKFYGYWEDDRLTVNWGYQNPWRIEMLGTNLVQLDLKGIIAAMEMPADKIVPLWKAYLNDIAANRNEIMRLPPSAIFQDKEVFQRFVTQYRIPTVKQRL